MEFRDALQRLEGDAAFEEWRAANKSYYLVHGFFEPAEAGKEARWQVGFYSKGADRIVTFVVGKDVGQLPPAEVFKKEEMIPALDVGQVKVDVADALQVARDCLAAEYKGEHPVKRFLILQNLGDGTVYNITFLTMAFKTINVKVSASTGAVQHHCLVELADFGNLLRK